MTYLFLGLLASNILNVIFKFASLKKWNTSKISLVNYVIAFGISLVSSLREGRYSDYRLILSADMKTLFSSPSAGTSLIVCSVIGVISGMMYMINLYVEKDSVATNGIMVTTFYGKASFVTGIIISALIWKEIPNLKQVIGSLMVIGALFVMLGNLKNLHAKRPRLLLQLIIDYTIMQVTSKSIANYSLPQHQSVYMTIVFGVALIACYVSNIIEARKNGDTLRMQREEVLAGITLGGMNMLASFFNLRALRVLPAYIAYPVQTAGGLVLMFLVSKSIFKEVTNKREILAVLIVAVSLVLVNS